MLPSSDTRVPVSAGARREYSIARGANPAPRCVHLPIMGVRIMASKLSDLPYRALDALLACHADAVRARRAAALAARPRRAHKRLRAMYVGRRAAPAALLKRTATPRPAHARLAHAGVAALLALVAVVTLVLATPPPT